MHESLEGIDRCCLPVVITLVQETLERRETSRDNELEIAKLTLSEDNGWDGLGLLEELLVNGLIADN